MFAVILAAGVLQWVEWRATPQSVLDDNDCARYGCLSFYEALYFVIVTVSDNIYILFSRLISPMVYTKLML
jgi:potassium large conductance calcium-activated channel subfamily M alpha protein 1